MSKLFGFLFGKPAQKASGGTANIINWNDIPKPEKVVNEDRVIEDLHFDMQRCGNCGLHFKGRGLSIHQAKCLKRKKGRRK